MTRLVTVVGIGEDGQTGLTEVARAAVADADVLYGSARQLEFFSDFAGEVRTLTSPLTGTLSDMEREAEERAVAVLASGDPLFHGIAKLIIRRLGAERVRVLPQLSSLQLAFARAGESWQDARFLSAHGHSFEGLAQRLHGAAKALVLTDDVHTPAELGLYLLQFGMTEYEAFVGERLGGEWERTAWYSLEQLAEAEFHPLNVVVLRRREGETSPLFPLGMPDEAFVQRKPDRGLITKREVRIQTLSDLELKPGQVMWDIGACTGSVSIEAIHLVPDLKVYAVEKNAEDLVNLRANQVKFRADFVAVEAKAPAGLDEFPDPDAVFVGGSGGELAELLQTCMRRARPGARVVVNAATIENLATAHQVLTAAGWNVSVTLLQTARSKPILQLTRMEGMNPVYLVRATMPVDGEGERE